MIQVEKAESVCNWCGFTQESENFQEYQDMGATWRKITTTSLDDETYSVTEVICPECLEMIRIVASDRYTQWKASEEDARVE